VGRVAYQRRGCACHVCRGVVGGGVGDARGELRLERGLQRGRARLEQRVEHPLGHAVVPNLCEVRRGCGFSLLSLHRGVGARRSQLVRYSDEWSCVATAGGVPKHGVV
jgi:hypothetical protein